MLPLASFPVQLALAPTKMGSVSNGSRGHDQVKRNDIGSALTAGLVATVGQWLKRRGRCHASLQESVARPPRRRKRLRDLKVGQELRGTVKAMLASHALVDVGAEFDAVLHASKMARGNKRPGDVVSEGLEIRVWVSGMRSEGIEFQKPLDRGSRGQSSTYHPKNETSKSAQWPKIISLSCFTCRFTVIVLDIYACEKNIEKHQTVSSLLCKHKEMALCRLWYSRRKYLENRCQARSDDAGSKGDQS